MVIIDWRHVSRILAIGPLTFIVLIDNPSTGCLMHKFVDDSTLSEIIGKDGVRL